MSPAFSQPAVRLTSGLRSCSLRSSLPLFDLFFRSPFALLFMLPLLYLVKCLWYALRGWLRAGPRVANTTYTRQAHTALPETNIHEKVRWL